MSEQITADKMVSLSYKVFEKIESSGAEDENPLRRSLEAVLGCKREEATLLVSLAVARIKQMSGIEDEGFPLDLVGQGVVGWVDGFLLGYLLAQGEEDG